MKTIGRLLIPSGVWIAMAAGQAAGPGPKISPYGEPLESVVRELSELPLKPQPAAVRPARLEIKPPGNPIYYVEESEWDGNQWRTYQRPKVDRFSKNSDGIAVDGYDVISYREKQAERGKAEFQVDHGGVIWQFVSDEHRRLFKAEPERYLPEYGGFCAYSVGRGYPMPVDPLAYAVAGSKLYLFFDQAVKIVWEQERSTAIEKAERNWPKLYRR